MTRDAAEQVRASLTSARDMQVKRVVAVVDAMPLRGEADGLIAPLRPRLAQLRPERPPNFIRLLFTPLNPVIVSLAEWQQCGIGVPRLALAPLGRAVRAALAAHDARSVNNDFTLEMGPILWPKAATVLETLTMPPDWLSSTGLTKDDFTAITSASASIMRSATDIERLVAAQRQSDEDTVRDIVFSSRARGVGAMDTMIAVLLARVPSPARIAAIIMALPGGDRAVHQALDRLVASLAGHARLGVDLREVAWQTARVGVMVTTLEESATTELRQRLEQVRRDAEAHCRHSFGQAVDQTLSLLASLQGEPANDEAIAAMESAARNARRLESAATQLGPATTYEAARLRAAAEIRGRDAELTVVDRARLVEILAGPAEALSLFRSQKEA